MITRAVITDDGAIEGLERIGNYADDAIERGLDLASASVARDVKANIQQTTERRTGELEDAYEFPLVRGRFTRVLGQEAPFYAAALEKGGRIVARDGEYLTFPLASGEWVRVSEVVLEPRQFVADALDEAESTGELGLIMGREIAREYERPGVLR